MNKMKALKEQAPLCKLGIRLKYFIKGATVVVLSWKSFLIAKDILHDPKVDEKLKVGDKCVKFKGRAIFWDNHRIDPELKGLS